MQLTASVLDMNWEDVETRLERFVRDYVRKSKSKGIVIGLSGGIDSAVIAGLCSRAIGSGRIRGLMLPEQETKTGPDIKHGKLVAEKFHFRTEITDITPVLDALYNSFPGFDPSNRLCKANVKARTRMIYLYYYANKHGFLVGGSSDKSETMMGYFTKWGDVAADIYPIMDLFKTQVRMLATHIGVPKTIVEKPSTPALWPGQLAESELGIKYEELDLVLYGLEHFMTTEEIAHQMDKSESVVRRIKERWLAAEHKRRMLLTAKLEYRTVGTDFRLPRDPT